LPAHALLLLRLSCCGTGSLADLNDTSSEKNWPSSQQINPAPLIGTINKSGTINSVKPLQAAQQHAGITADIVPVEVGVTVGDSEFPLP